MEEIMLNRIKNIESEADEFIVNADENFKNEIHSYSYLMYFLFYKIAVLEDHLEKFADKLENLQEQQKK